METKSQRERGHGTCRAQFLTVAGGSRHVLTEVWLLCSPFTLLLYTIPRWAAAVPCPLPPARPPPLIFHHFLPSFLTTAFLAQFDRSWPFCLLCACGYPGLCVCFRCCSAMAALVSSFPSVLPALLLHFRRIVAFALRSEYLSFDSFIHSVPFLLTSLSVKLLLVVVRKALGLNHVESSFCYPWT